jgi:hypothetical protein
MRTLARTVVMLLVLAVAAFAYYRVGWSRMEDECSTDRSMAGQRGIVTYSWSWTPPGFTCTYSGGYSETSLWF